MSIKKEQRKELIEKFGKNAKDSGSTKAQVAIISTRIKNLTEHFKKNPTDHGSRRGLYKLVSKRRHLLDYLKKRSEEEYKTLISALGIRK